MNGKTVEVVAGQPAVVELGVKELGARGLAALQVSRLEVGAGTVLVLGGPVSHLRPGGTLELAFTQPLGPVLLGVVADWDLRTWSTPTGGAVFDPLAVSGGLRLGRELAVSGPLALRPSLGVRAGFEPGIGLACRYEEGDLSAVACGPGWGGDVVDTQVHVFVDATTVSPFAELAVEYRQGGRTTALGVGVKLGLEEQILLLPSEGEAQVSTGADGSGATIRYSSDVSTATATGIRLAAVADFAF